MPSRRAKDYPGAWWHVTNRGIAKRTAFENGHDVETFLALLAAQVEGGLLEVHAYAVMTTHLHLLVRSRQGRLPRAMQLVFRGYVGWFNRARKRDGSLFRGRYKARLIEDGVYWENTLRYIDLNPVRARMCLVPSAYPFGSARHYASRERPAWLTTDWVEGVVAGEAAGAVFRREEYDAFSVSTDEGLIRQLIEPGLEARAHARTPPLTDLVRSASRRQQRWFQWKAALADGSQPGAVLVPVSVLDRVLDRLPGAVRTHRALRAGLLRELAALSFDEVAERIGTAASTAHAAVRSHDTRSRADTDYRVLVARIVDLAVRSSPLCRGVGVEPVARGVV